MAFLVSWRGWPSRFCRREATYPFAPRGFPASAWPVVSVSPLKPALARRKPGSAGLPRLASCQTPGCVERVGFLVRWRGCGLVDFVGVRQAIRLRHAVSRLRLGPWSGDLFKPAVASTGRGASRGKPLAALGIRAKSAELPCLASCQTRAASSFLVRWRGWPSCLCRSEATYPFAPRGLPASAWPVVWRFVQARRGFNRAWRKPGQPPSCVGPPGKN